jgi:hypothetical protein
MYNVTKILYVCIRYDNYLPVLVATQYIYFGGLCNYANLELTPVFQKQLKHMQIL